MDWLGLTVALIIMFVGLIGMLIPLLPGAPLIILGMVVYGLFYEFGLFTWIFWVGQGLMLALVYVVDYIASVLGARYYGASSAAIWGCIIGGLAGLVILGPIGIVLGPLFGAIVGELISGRPPAYAVKAGIGALFGLAGGVAAKIIIGLGMIAWFLWVVF
ncbi:DUF456 domain-containing protein [Thermodesulfovibrionales bacterium]|nr:DUF456 domain-containing protein [Thermodesulfovibrionales bacterium]